MRASMTTLKEACCMTEMTFQPRGNRRYALRHIPTYSGFVYTGIARECIFWMHGLKYAKEQKMPLESDFFESPLQEKFLFKHLNGYGVDGKRKDWPIFVAGANYWAGGKENEPTT